MISLPDWRGRPRALAAAFLAVIALSYLWFYAHYDARPGLSLQHPLGWWGYSDQGEYLKSMRALLSGVLRPEDFLYPPLYALVCAPFLLISPAHPTLIPDLVLCLVFYGGLFAVARRFYGAWLPGLVCLAMFALAPIASLEQWVVPWTSSLQAALAAVLFWLFSRAEARPDPFRIARRGDWLGFFLFFLIYGAMAPTRPLDAVAWFPFALAYFLRSLFATARGSDRPLRAVLACAALAGVGGALFAAGYIGFNLKLTGSPFGLYAVAAGGNGYFPADLVEKLFSIFWNSGAVYGEGGQAIFERLPLLAPAVAVSLVAAVLATDVRRWIVLTAVVQVLLYLPYGDLLPTGVFRYFNIHYFKWAIAWLTVIGVGQLVIWLRRPAAGQARTGLAAAILLLFVGALIGIRPAREELVADTRLPSEHLIRVATHARRQVEFVDIRGLTGDFTDFYLTRHTLTVDDRPVPASGYRLLPTVAGGRLVFLRPVSLKALELKPNPAVHFSGGPGKSLLVSAEIGLSCRLRACPPPLEAPLERVAATGTTVYRFGQGGDFTTTGLSAWWEPEAGLRWTRAAAARVDATVLPGGAVSVATTVRPLLGGARKTARVTLSVNGCQVAEGSFDRGAPQTLGGSVKPSCLRPDGWLQIEWRVDKATSPKALKLGPDPRKLGVAVESLTVQRTD